MDVNTEQTPAAVPSHSRDDDAAFLNAALHWIEMRLRKLAHAAGHGKWEARHDSELHSTHAALKAALANRLSFLQLIERLCLTQFESELLLLCLVNEMSPMVARLCGRVTYEDGNFVSLAAARELFPENFDWNALSPERPLRRLRILDINQPVGRTLMTSPLRVEERVFQYARGARTPDDRLTAWLRRCERAEDVGPLPESHLTIVQAILDRLGESPKGSTLPVIQLVGPDPLGKRLIAAMAAGVCGRTLYRGAAGALPSSVTELDQLARIWERECRLLPQALFLEADELDPPDSVIPESADHAASGAGFASAGAQALLRLVARTRRFVFLSVRERWPIATSGRESLTFDIHRPEPEEQEEVWVHSLGGDLLAENAATILAGQFDLHTATIRRLARNVPRPKIIDQDTIKDWNDTLWDSCRSEIRPHLESLAAHLDPKADWDRLVLPQPLLTQLEQIADQVRYRHIVYRRWGLSDRISRGLGLSVLFAGQSGTGKTLAAEVLAKELRLDLFVIDLSAIVNKYIGETEKNLRRLFDAAEEGGCALLFNEADALFGKRSTVQDSKDRFANIEIDYLLQRMEEFRGLAILTTNRKSDLDVAFLRRLRFVVDFPIPDVSQRIEIWKKLLPPIDKSANVDDLVRQMFARRSQRHPQMHRVIPTKNLDYSRLAGFPLNGGGAFNASLNAAFLAAAAQSPVEMEHVLAAIKAEMQKQQISYWDSDFVQSTVPPTPSPRQLAAERLRLSAASHGSGGTTP